MRLFGRRRDPHGFPSSTHPTGEGVTYYTSPSTAAPAGTAQTRGAWRSPARAPGEAADGGPESAVGKLRPSDWAPRGADDRPIRRSPLPLNRPSTFDEYPTPTEYAAWWEQTYRAGMDEAVRGEPFSHILGEDHRGASGAVYHGGAQYLGGALPYVQWGPDSDSDSDEWKRKSESQINRGLAVVMLGVFAGLAALTLVVLLVFNS